MIRSTQVLKHLHILDLSSRGHSFFSENIFPVLGEYSTNVEYSIILVVLNRTRLLKHGDTFGTIVSNIIDKYGNQIISIKPSGNQQISTEPS